MAGEGTVPANPMKSTWKKDKVNQPWSHHHWLLYLIDGSYKYDKSDVPVFKETDKVPVLSVWRSGGWMLWRSLAPIAIHYVLHVHYGIHLSAAYAFALYFPSFVLIAVNHLHMLRWVGTQHGYFDGTVARDDTPDMRVRDVAFSLFFTVFARTVLMIALVYEPDQAPKVDPLMLIIQVGVYTVSLDFYFYWYHRLMHEVDFLWRFHKTHHNTKHPNAQLSLYADTEQEWFDIVFVPLASYYTTKLFVPSFDFYAWWISGLQVLFIEAWGHSGIRIYATPANAFLGALRWFGAELTIEDHDWHHRAGWRKSHNYGKQTRLWDMVFGTKRDRLEAKEDNIDWNKAVKLPLL